jgi:hypothetical protein
MEWEQIWLLKPVVPYTQEAEAGGSLSQEVQKQPGNTLKLCLKKNKKSLEKKRIMCELAITHLHI